MSRVKVFQEKYEKKIGISSGVKGYNLKTLRGRGMDIYIYFEV